MSSSALDRFSVPQLVRDALIRFSLEEVEGALIHLYLRQHGLETVNRFLKCVMKQETEEAAAFLEKMAFKDGLKGLEAGLGVLVGRERREAEGVVYTPDFVVDYISRNTIDRPGRMIDLSCGTGAFLLGAIRRMKELSCLSYREIVENCIYGVDVSEESIRHAKIIITLLLIEQGEDCESIDFNLAAGDALDIFGEGMPEGTAPFSGIRFDFVLGNPPYVRFQDLNEDRRTRLSSGWKSVKGFNFNLYFVFFELGMNILDARGKLGFIVPNSFFTTYAARNLRIFLHSSGKIRRILNFNHIKLFPSASTYTCIVIIDNSWHHGYFEYAYVDNRGMLPELQDLDLEKISSGAMSEEKWRLLGSRDRENIRKIECAGEQIGKKFRISVGVATLRDDVYMVEELDGNYCSKNLEGTTYKVEHDVTRRAVKIPLVSDETGIRRSRMRIIFPYRKDSKGRFTVIGEEEMLEKYPHCMGYLNARRDELEKRDKGKPGGQEWYAYGRAQGFDSYGPRLYTRTFSRRPSFIRDDGDALFCNGYAIFMPEDIEVYQKILNSGVMDYYMKKTSSEIDGNYQCYQKNFIEKFSIPELSSGDKDYIRSETSAGKLDAFLSKMYGIRL